MAFGISPEQTLLSLFLIAPGFVAVLMAINLGVVEQQVRETVLFGASLVTSVFIDTIFLGIYQATGGEISGLNSTETIFFSPDFQPHLVFALIGLSVGVGLVYSIGLIYDLPRRFREGLWAGSDYSRHPRQPWEGALWDAHEINVITSDREMVNGVISEHSRVGKERQLLIDDPRWLNQESGELESGIEISTLLFEDDIERLSILTKNEDGEENQEE